jgi:hypothetical protein
MNEEEAKEKEINKYKEEEEEGKLPSSGWFGLTFSLFGWMDCFPFHFSTLRYFHLVHYHINHHHHRHHGLLLLLSLCTPSFYSISLYFILPRRRSPENRFLYALIRKINSLENRRVKYVAVSFLPYFACEVGSE